MIHHTPSVPTSGLFMHTIADLPGGVTLHSENLGGAYLQVGTPIGKAEKGIYQVEKIAATYTEIRADSKELKVEKGHHFLAGDYIAADIADGQRIVSVNKQSVEYDILTLVPMALVAASTLVPREGELYCGAWLICVVKEKQNLPIAQTLREHLKTVLFV